MSLDENEFFREATIRICGSLEIDTSLSRCADFLKEHIPMGGIFLYFFELRPPVMKVISNVSFHKGKGIASTISMPKEAKPFIEWPEDADVRCINDEGKDPIAKEVSKSLHLHRASYLAMRLRIDGKKLVGVTLYTDGRNRYTEKHCQLLTLLYEPFVIAMSNALQHRSVKRLMEIVADDNQYLNRELLRYSGDEIIGGDYGLRRVMESVQQVASLGSSVLLLGETGVGKEVVANAIHFSSSRRDKPFIKVNCGAIPEYLVDSELFGYEKGAFTGAISMKRGHFERAQLGTILLDEIGDLPTPAQTRLLRVLQNKEIERVGGEKPIPVDVRVIAATHQNLEEMVKNKKFRKDLWYRLNVFPIVIPPLRKRKEDIPALVHHFIEKTSRDLKILHPPELKPGVLPLLMDYDWPGNVRELENLVERALIENRGEREGMPLNFSLLRKTEPESNENLFVDPINNSLKLDDLISRHIRSILTRTEGKINGRGGAAELLGIKPNTLRSKMNKLGIPYGRRTINKPR
jgi:transcriptional regulator with GAF, ATPase, and Fis domain